MSAEKNLPSAGREFERGFGWTLLLSGAAHVIVLGGLLFVPGVRPQPAPRLKSYSVDLIDPNKLGGTNLIAGAKGKSAAPPKIEPAKAKAPEPPPAEAKSEPPPPPPEVKEEPPPPPKEAAKPPEPPRAEPPPDENAIALDRKVEPTPTPVQVAKAVPPTVAPTVVKEIPPTAAPTKAKPTTMAKAQATPTVESKAVAKGKTTPTQAKVAKGQATPTRAAPQAVAKANVSPGAKPNASPGAKAVGSPAKPGTSPGAAKTTPGADPKARDDRIAAAIKRIEQQAGTRGGGSGGGGGDSPGGPISIGPGEGAGGEVRGIAFIMYTNRLEAMIKEKWVWAGQDPTLRADIGFNILPSGEVVNVRTVASSGDANYDRRAETAVRAAAPFPAPPEEYQAEFETGGFVYTFEPN